MYISVINVVTSDLDRAIEFYTKTLGWEKTMDQPMGDGTRWVTVAPKGEKTMFTLSTPERDESWKAGGFSGIVLEVDDVHRTYGELTKRGVEFQDTPADMPWGGWATFKDSEGNVHGLHSPARVPMSNN